MVKVVRLKKGVDEKVREGILTIYSKWIHDTGGAETGDEVIIEDFDRKNIGIGIYDGVGPVALRVLSVDKIAPISEILRENILRAFKLRKRFGWKAYRLVNSEADNIPGMVIDVYNDIAVIQSGSGGLDEYLNYIASILVKERIADRVYVKNTQRSRREVGLEIWRDWIYGGGDTVTTISEGEARFIVDIENGQKTGFFLDQRMNRMESKLYSKDSIVLDLFSYTGGFGIHALLNGARKAVFVEEDKLAVEILTENLRINHQKERGEIYNVRVEDFLEEYKDRFNLVFSDPPAFIQNRKNIKVGIKKYRSILEGILRFIHDDAIIFFSSCSYFLKTSKFIEIINSELSSRRFKYSYIGRVRGASPDHPYREHSELNYLKSIYIRIS